MYTRMFHSCNYGGVVFQPILLQFPNYELTYNNNDFQFILGDALLISLVLNYLQENNITAYFLDGNWNEIPSGKNKIDFYGYASSGVNFNY